MNVNVLHSFFLCPDFVILCFTSKVFNETVLTIFLKFYNDNSRGSVIRKYVNNIQYIKGMLVTFVK